MKRFLLLFFMAVVLSTPLYAQLSYKWTPIMVDSTWNDIRDTRATEIIAKYSPRLEPLYEVVGHSDREYTKHRPESELSSFAVDIIRYTAAQASGTPVDIAMTNFGGIRTSLPKGDVRVYDILSIFPFNNCVVYFDIKGEDFRHFLEDCGAHHRLEAFSGCTMTIDGETVKDITVGGSPIEDGKIYRMATIDFLMDGGDGINLTKQAINLVNTKVFIREAIVDYMRQMMKRGENIELKMDGRVKEEGR